MEYMIFAPAVIDSFNINSGKIGPDIFPLGIKVSIIVPHTFQGAAEEVEKLKFFSKAQKRQSGERFMAIEPLRVWVHLTCGGEQCENMGNAHTRSIDRQRAWEKTRRSHDEVMATAGLEGSGR